jgi:hypothetical protein
MQSSNQPCDYRDAPDSEACGKTPTTLIAHGMDTPSRRAPATGAGTAGGFEYAHYCDEHISLMRDRLNRQ